MPTIKMLLLSTLSKDTEKIFPYRTFQRGNYDIYLQIIEWLLKPNSGFCITLNSLFWDNLAQANYLK